MKQRHAYGGVIRVEKGLQRMRVYLDNCCFNRPFDDQSSLTIRLETEAKLHVQDLIRMGQLALGWSYILDYENAANPYDERRQEIQQWETLAEASTPETPEILTDMNRFIAFGLKPVDALHIACAMSLQCDVFLTVDKGIHKKKRNIHGIRILNPIDFMIEWEANNAG